MRKLIITLCFCLGTYFTTALGSLIVLRKAGHYTPLFNLLEIISGYLPYASIPILLSCGFITVLKPILKQPLNMIIQGAVVVVISAIPFLVFAAMYKFTYSDTPLRPKLFGLLSVSEWLGFFIGCFLLGLATVLLTHGNDNQ